MKIKTILLYTVPFLLSVLITICCGIPETLAFVVGWLFVSIFMLGAPILAFCLPYWLYFLYLGKYFKKPFWYSFLASFGTILLLVMFLIGSAKMYKPIENKIYFTNDVKTMLTKRSLTLFEERMNTKGKVKEINKISRMEGWNDVEVSGLVEGRKLQIVVIPKNKEDKLTIHYNYLYKDGKWSLESTN
ncbi:hypothetical protein J5Y03_16990 [Bacillus sp. RG28]|uniref:Uncharacterized protein n=1 Tax=Gottfriedia endophytica TaxID=2820819 RepID=A0A940NS69_9BACI|nr:hypothetical protein [Gottfriedia endophytica]MBP0726855.1 hypothetical protein [Gottfriedia endophytica]